MEGRASAQRHWIALDAAFSRTLSPEELGCTRDAFTQNVAALSDACSRHLSAVRPREEGRESDDDASQQLRETGAALKAALSAAWRATTT